jgi:hypothetical protein
MTNGEEVTMGGWGCPHEANGMCQRVKGKPCDPGMKGCVLYGRVRFSVEEKNRPGADPLERRARDKARRGPAR